MSQTVRRQQQEVPVHSHSQVLVVGAGPAGFAAAVTAARRGAQVTLVERGGCLGGMWTLGLLSPYFDNRNKGGLNRELRELLGVRNAWGGLQDISFDRCQMIMALDEIAVAAGVKLLLYAMAEETLTDGDRVTGIVAATKSGPVALLADIVIDCTGDGDVAARAGAEFELGRPEDRLMQPMTMMFKVGGVRDDYPRDDIIGWYNRLSERTGIDALLREIPYDYPAIIRLPRPGEALIQWTHVKRSSGIDADQLTAATLEGRRQVRAGMEFLKNIRDVIGDVYLLDLPETIGVRETRRILGDYHVSDDDVKQGTVFDDGICQVKFGIDIHEPDKKAQTVIRHQGFQIPFRSLLPRGFANLLTAGRCISGSWIAHAAYRVTGDCVAMGEAAGTAAALAVSRNRTLRELDGAEIAALVEGGCR